MSNQKVNNQSGHDVYEWPVYLSAFIVCIVLWWGGMLFTHKYAVTEFETTSKPGITDQQLSDEEVKGLFGDSFGAVNALVSALAFAGVIVSLYFQRKDLKLQREELALTRQEMSDQTMEFEKQNETLKIQRFESLFYNMLNLQQQIVDGLRYDYYDDEKISTSIRGSHSLDRKLVKKEVVGRDVFRHLFVDARIYTGNGGLVGYKWYLHVCGLENYDGTLIPSYFDHYFRHLYKIVQFVDSQELSFDEKYRYLSFLRGTLSRYELVWLYYNSLHPDFYRFKQLIERYSLLKALRRDLLSVSKETVTYYENLGITDEDLRKNEFGTDDFAFYLTDNPKEDSKYMISAFWNSKDHQIGVDYLNRWNTFVAKTAGNVVKD